MSAKALVLRPIPRDVANDLMCRLHYSGKVCNNSQLHIGVYWQGRLEGAMQFGPSMVKRKLQGLVAGTGWNEFVELNRMAFGEALPRNSESRALAVAMRLLRQHAPHVQWVVTFADACQCGDGTIYRAAGFVLTAIKPNEALWVSPDGRTVTHSLAAYRGYGADGGLNFRRGSKLGGASMRAYAEAGWRRLPGYQCRYIYFLDPSCRERLTVPVLPYSEIPRRGAGMYRGTPRVRPLESEGLATSQTGRCDATRTLQCETEDGTADEADN